MIEEHVLLSIAGGRGEAFLSMMEGEGSEILLSAAGVRGVDLRRGVERPNVCVLMIFWADLKSRQTFRRQDAFRQLAGKIGAFVTERPLMEHFTRIETIGSAPRVGK